MKMAPDRNIPKYLREGTGFSDRLRVEHGAKLKAKEWRMVLWILKELSGKVRVLKVSEEEGVKSADILYRGHLFDLKQTAGTLNTLDKHIRYAGKQTKGYGVFVNISGAKYRNGEALVTVMNRMVRDGLVEAYIIRNWRMVAHVYRSNNKITVDYPPSRGT